MRKHHSRRHRLIYGVGASALSASVAASVLAACSGGGSVAAGGGTQSALSASCESGSCADGSGTAAGGGIADTGTAGSTASTSSLPGPENTDPDYTPKVLGGPSGDPTAAQAKQQYTFVPPYSYDFPASWKPASWYASVGNQLGAPMVFATLPPAERGSTSESVQVPIPGGAGHVEVNVVVLATGQVHSVQCAAGGFDPSSAAARSMVLKDLLLCAAADFPGSDPSKAEAWVRSQSTVILDDLPRMSDDQVVRGATPIFGGGIYWLGAENVDGKSGWQVTLNVYGSHA